MNLNDKEWKEFIIGEIFDDIVNSKAYHKNNLAEVIENPIPYITRTKNNNGLEKIVENSELDKNPKNTIVFGAESATFFYEPFEYVTGNKMYYIKDKHFNKYVCLFLVSVLNNLVEKNFSYSRGLTGTRLTKQRIMLPINDDNLPDYEFMEDFMKYKENEILQVYKKYLSDTEQFNVKSLDDNNFESIEWKGFYLSDLFEDIQRGKRLTKSNFIDGTTPYISSSAENNGVDNYIGNKEKVQIYNNCITLANSGSVGSTFYHPYTFVASDHVTHLKNDNFNKYIYLFLASIIKRLESKYNFNREINDTRLKNEVIMLPVTETGEINYQFMEDYIKHQEAKLIKKYLDYLTAK